MKQPMLPGAPPKPAAPLRSGPRPKGRWHKRTRQPGEMNGDEKRYYQHLLERHDVVEVAYEPESLRLAKATWYKPDFRVLTVDGEIQFHEVKGYVEEAGRVRIKIAAELHPYRFFQVKRRAKKDGGGWTVEEINPSEPEKPRAGDVAQLDMEVAPV